jgi:hypothetical protein
MWWSIPAIPAAQDVEVEGLQSEASPSSQQDLSKKYTKTRIAGGMAQVV